MHTHGCRYLLVYNTISTQEYHSNTQHTAKTLGLTNYHIGFRRFYSLLDHTSHHTQGRTHLLLQRLIWNWHVHTIQEKTVLQLPVTNVRKQKVRKPVTEKWNNFNWNKTMETTYIHKTNCESYVSCFVLSNISMFQKCLFH